MKRILLSVTLCLIASGSFAQLGFGSYNLNFEDTILFVHLRMDSSINHNNLWQISAPQKTVFISAYSTPNVIVTDNINPYPVSDTSSFELVNRADQGWTYPHTVTISGYYWVNSDSLTDYGTIEVSPDNGTTWIDLINDTSYTSYYTWWSAKPILSGNSNGWQYLNVWFADLGPLFNVQIGDTTLYRFTFISDSVQTNKDGLMYDDLNFVDYAEGIDEIKNNNLISIYPNPADENLFIQKSKRSNSASVEVFNYTGQLVFQNKNFNGETISTKNLQNGFYVLKYSDGNNYSMKKFLVQH